MKFNLRDKTTLIIVITSLIALVTAGLFISRRVDIAFERFLEDQVRLFDRMQEADTNTLQPFPGIRRFVQIRQEAPHQQLEEQFVREVWRGLTLAGIVAVGMSFIIGMLFSSLITKPLVRLKKHIAKVKQHEYDDRLDMKGSDEIAELGHDFDELREELGRVEELRKDAVSDLAHEITTPLQSLLGIVEGIEEGIYDGKEKVEDMKTSIEQLRRMIDDLRLFSHARAKVRDVDLQAIPFLQFIQSTCAAVFFEAEKKGLTVGIAVSADATIRADADMLAHILTNLVKNAMQYTKQGSIIIEAHGKEVSEFSVRDTGSGINAKDLPYIFERFYRGDQSRSRETGGTGLGLSIVKEYIDQLGWQITVQSEAGVGSEFRIKTQ